MWLAISLEYILISEPPKIQIEIWCILTYIDKIISKNLLQLYIRKFLEKYLTLLEFFWGLLSLLLPILSFYFWYLCEMHASDSFLAQFLNCKYPYSQRLLRCDVANILLCPLYMCKQRLHFGFPAIQTQIITKNFINFNTVWSVGQ